MNEKDKMIDIIRRIKVLLSNRPKNMELIDILKSIYEQYVEMIPSLEDNISRPKMLKEGLIETIDKVIERIFLSLYEYYNGRISSAEAEMDFLFQELGLILPEGYNQYCLNTNDIWFRGRMKNEGVRVFAKNEMFHIPNHLRENVSNQRFSFNGYPCLYMGKSLWTCWEELGEPHLDDICFSAIKTTKHFKLFDLSIPTEEAIYSKTQEELITMLILLPLKIACSIKTKNEKLNFKAEYIIPQLLMIELIEHSLYDGYIFTSTKENPTFGWNERYLLNIVLPVQGEFDKDGLCIRLKEKMHITEPICHQYEILKSNISNIIPASTQELDFVLENGYEISDKDDDIYPRTIFGQMEKILRESEFYEL